MSLFVERKADTEFGEVEISITRGEHMCVKGKPEVRGTKFDCILHFYRQPDNTWAIRAEDRPSMSRAWAGDAQLYRKPAPPSYFQKVLDAYTRVVNAFAIASPKLFVEAESAELEREIERTTEKMNKAQKEFLDAVADVSALKLRKHQLAH